MDCIIKNTKTVDEFKRVRASMEEQAKRYSRRHIASCEHWQEGMCKMHFPFFIACR